MEDLHLDEQKDSKEFGLSGTRDPVQTRIETLCVLKVRKQKRTLTLASNPFPSFILVRLRSICCDVNDVKVAFEINQMCSQLITAADLLECSSFKHS